MTDKKKMKYCFVPVPFIPVWEFPDGEDHEEDWENIKSTVNTLWKQIEDMQKESIDASKKQWDTFFAQTVKMQETFIDSLPDEPPSVPGLPPAPVPSKEQLKKRKEAREERNKYNKEQFDSFLDYAKKRQDKIKDAITDGVKKAEDEVKKKKDSKTEKKAEPKTAKKPRSTRAAKN